MHGNVQLHRRLVEMHINARQATSSGHSTRTRSRPTRSSTGRSTTTEDTSSSRSTETPKTEDRPRPSPVVTTSTTSRTTLVSSSGPPRQNTQGANLPTNPSSSSSAALASRTSAAASTSALPNTSGTRSAGSIVGGILGAMVGIVALAALTVFIVRHVRKRKERLDEARHFNREKLERPGMVRGVEAGPGVSWPGSAGMKQNGNESGEASMLTNENEKTVLLFPKPPFATERNSLTSRGSYSDVPATPPKTSPGYGNVNPFASPATVPGSLYELYNTDISTGAPPMPGTQSPAPYGSYTNSGTYPSSRVRQGSLLSNHPATPPPGSMQMPMVAPTNPFASPAGSRRGSSASATSSSNLPRSHSLAHSFTPQAHNQSNNVDLPPLRSFGFLHDTRPDSSHSATFSEAHVGQAVKVQIGAAIAAAPVKYEDLRREGPVPQPSSAATPANGINTVAPATGGAKSRPPSSYTVYDPEDAYGGV